MNHQSTMPPEVSCEAPCTPRPHVEQAREKLLPEGVLSEMRDIFRILGDPLRLQIVQLLSQTELCVCDLSDLLQAGQTTISNHLRILRDNRLVKTRRVGKLIFYRLEAPHLTRVIAEAIAQVTDRDDAERSVPPRSRP